MDQALKDRWADALTNGQYKPGKNALRRGENFCALGVLYDLVYGQWYEGLGENDWITIHGTSHLLSGEVLNKVRLPDEVQVAISSLNDAHVSWSALAYVLRHGELADFVRMEDERERKLEKSL